MVNFTITIDTEMDDIKKAWEAYYGKPDKKLTKKVLTKFIAFLVDEELWRMLESIDE